MRRMNLIMMRSTFKDSDITLLLKDLTGIVEPVPVESYEKLIQSGGHYSDYIACEDKPSCAYENIFRESILENSSLIARLIINMARQIVWSKCNDEIVLVSFARAGLPVGILLKRYLEKILNREIPHYGISIIKDKGIDRNALNYVLKRHNADSIIFVDGWTGRGKIYNELVNSLADYAFVNPSLAVLADPAGVAQYFGTCDDILIPNACLNALVSGLISRTIIGDYVNGDDFHGAVYFKNLELEDLTYYFINHVWLFLRKFMKNRDSTNDLEYVVSKYCVDEKNIKFGYNEVLRILLRRIPDKIIISSFALNNKNLEPIRELCREKGIPILYDYLCDYDVCGIIKTV